MKPPYIMLSRNWLDQEPQLREAYNDPNPDLFLIHLFKHPYCSPADKAILNSIGWGRICIEENDYGMIAISRAEEVES